METDTDACRLHGNELHLRIITAQVCLCVMRRRSPVAL